MEHIIDISRRVREKIEVFIAQKHEENSEFEIDKYNLAGACAISSWLLNKVLRKNKIHSELIMGYYQLTPHSWVKLIKDNKILDITATQFDFDDKIYITNDNSNRNYIKTNEGKSAEYHLAAWGNQSPQKYETELRKIYEELV